MVQTTISGAETRTVLPLTTQRSLFMEIEEIPDLTVDQLRFRTNSEKLRERGINVRISPKELRELAAEALVMTFKAMAGREGATAFQRQKAQNEALAKCMTGDFEGLLEAVGINTEAFLDQVRRTFPDDSPRQALIKFANLTYQRHESISVEEEEARQRERLKDYDEFF